MKRKNNQRPRLLPCGTPVDAFTGLDMYGPNFTEYCRSVRYNLSHIIMGFEG